MTDGEKKAWVGGYAKAYADIIIHVLKCARGNSKQDYYAACLDISRWMQAQPFEAPDEPEIAQVLRLKASLAEIESVSNKPTEA